MRGVILAGGKGTRLSDVTNGTNKCLLKVREKSLIQYNVEHMCNLDEISECIIVVGYHAEEVMREVGNEQNHKKITYCIQQQQKGLINALESAITAIGDEDFFMILGDEIIIRNNYIQAITKFKESDVSSLIGIYDAKDIELVKKTYTFQLDEDGTMSNFIEKPVHPFNSYMGTGNVLFKGEILKLIDDIPVNLERGEKELVGVLNLIQEQNKKISSFRVGDYYFNVNTRNDLEMLKRINLN